MNYIYIAILIFLIYKYIMYISLRNEIIALISILKSVTNDGTVVSFDRRSGTIGIRLIDNIHIRLFNKSLVIEMRNNNFLKEYNLSIFIFYNFLHKDIKRELKNIIDYDSKRNKPS